MKYKLLGENKQENFILEVLKNRGIEDIYSFMYPTEDILNEPINLDNINEGYIMLKKHLNEDSKILILVDCDADGITSSAIVYNFIKIISKNINIDYAIHEGKQHGLSEDIYIPSGNKIEDYNLIIIPDAGTNDYEKHKVLKKEHNIDILILDHHESDNGYSEYACVINNQLSEKYNNKKLSGAGVVWQFIRHYIETEKLENVKAEYFLDLVALGNIADVMDMRSPETRLLVNAGSRNINNCGFKSLCEKQSFSMKNKVNPTTVGWYIGPLINAVLRSGTLEEKDMLFKSFLDINAEKYIESGKRGAKGSQEKLTVEFARIASNVRNRQNKIVDSGIELIDKIIKEKDLLKNKILLIKIDADVLPAEVIGLIANKIASKYKMPTLIGRDIDGILKGSGRNFENSPLEDMRMFLEDSGMIDYAQGHSSAFGFALDLKKLSSFIEYCNDKLKDIVFEAIPSVDFVFDFQYTPSLVGDKAGMCVLELGNYESYWGQGIQEPLLCFKNIDNNNKITLMSPDKKPTLKIECEGISFIKFNSNQEEYENFINGNKSINILGRININEWLGKKYPQILIENYEFEELKKVYRF